jgi:hypothetical protein
MFWRNAEFDDLKKVHTEAVSELNNLKNNTETLRELADFILNRKS